MGSDLRRKADDGSAVDSAEFVVSSARLGELYECSALIRRTRQRSEEIVDEARALLAEARQEGDAERVVLLTGQLEQARQTYAKVLNAYLILIRKINEERQQILQAQMERDRHDAGLSGVV
jgi:RecA/RadA recombinase